MAEEQKPKKKIGEVEFMLVLMVLITTNTICAILNFTIILAPLTPIINIPVFLGMQFYLRMRNMKPNKMLIGGIAEFMPGINILPIDITTWVFTTVSENNPKLAGLKRVTKPTHAN